MENDDKDSSKDKYKSVDANEEFIINRKLYASRGLDYDELKRKQKEEQYFYYKLGKVHRRHTDYSPEILKRKLEAFKN